MSSRWGRLLVIAALLAGCSQNGDLPGFAPDFRLDTLSHRRFYLNEHRGKVVVLVFWMTICTICKEEKVGLNTLHRALEPRGVVVASVCSDPENLDTVHRIARRLEIDYPILLDHGAKVSKKYSVQVLPTTVVIGPRGRLRFIRVGYSPSIMRQIRSKAESLLSEGLET
ncbi:MAG: TlpA family protein disulfide reductase [Deltaproteobacteria bacterium]|nr:MAG: TlpA family protein disulfide reductase [Deltaproteobacteria bacterium]